MAPNNIEPARPLASLGPPIGVALAAWAVAWVGTSQHRSGGEGFEAAAWFGVAAVVTLACTVRVLWVSLRLRAALRSGSVAATGRTRAALAVGAAWCAAMALLAFVTVFGLG